MLESISDVYLFGLCIGLSALLIAPLAGVEGAEDALTKFLIKREWALRKPQRARPQLAFAARMRGRKAHDDQQRARPNRRKQPAAAVAKKAAKGRAT